MKTMKNLMDQVKTSQSLKEPRKREIVSALRTACRAIGRQPADIIATPAELRKELEAANYTLAGVDQKRWTAVRYLTLKALRTTGSKVAPSRRTCTDYPESWKALRATLTDQYLLIGLSRFMGFCVANSIAPAEVDAEVFERFRVELMEGSIVRNAETIYGRTCRLWDKAGDQVIDWPAFRTGVAPARKGYSLAWDQFPAPLREDVEAFLNRCANDDIYSDDYTVAIRPATVIARRKVLRQMATALVQGGIPIEDIRSLRPFVQPENAKTILRHFDNRRGKLSEATYSHASLLCTVARTWVKNVPDYSALDALKRNVGMALRRGGKRRGMKQRNIDRLRQFKDPRNIEALLGLPSKLMRRATQSDAGTSEAATIALYAAGIEILLFTAMRIRNLAGLKLGENLILPFDTRANISIVVPGEDVKNGRPIDVLLPTAPSSLVRTYLEKFRPRLSKNPSTCVFPNSVGNGRNTTGFGAKISDVIYTETGLKMHPHLFRHFSLMLLEQARPGSAEIGRRFLGHYNIQTTLNSYAENDAHAAHKMFEDVIEANRANLRLDLGDRK